MEGREGVKGRPLPSLYVVKVVLYFKDEETDFESKGPRASKEWRWSSHPDIWIPSPMFFLSTTLTQYKGSVVNIDNYLSMSYTQVGAVACHVEVLVGEFYVSGR